MPRDNHLQSYQHSIISNRYFLVQLFIQKYNGNKAISLDQTNPQNSLSYVMPPQTLHLQHSQIYVNAIFRRESF